jgi:hypothetical protein
MVPGPLAESQMSQCRPLRASATALTILPSSKVAVKAQWLGQTKQKIPFFVFTIIVL